MNFLLDTCVISELVKAQPDENTMSWIDSVDEEHLFISVLTLGELEKGISKLQTSKRKDRLRAWLEEDMTQRFSHRILPVDVAIVGTWGQMQGEAERNGNSLPVIDSLLSATASAYNLAVATRNVVDFERCGAVVFNPWDTQS